MTLWSSDHSNSTIAMSPMVSFSLANMKTLQNSSKKKFRPKRYSVTTQQRQGVMCYWQQTDTFWDILLLDVRGAIKKFSAWPSSVQNKIKIVFASYSSKDQNTTCTIWLLGYKYFVHFSSCRLFAFHMEKTELCSVMKWQFWPIWSFHCMLCCSDSESKL